MEHKPDVEKLRSFFPKVDIGAILGEGGYKIAYDSKFDGKQEAFKVVHIPQDPNEKAVQEENIRRLFREIKLLGECETPYLVKLGTLPIRRIEINGEVYVVYSEEKLEGKSIRLLIQGGSKPNIRVLATIGHCCLHAVDELWKKKNVVHRDIKPDNIMALDESKRPYVLLDLGVAFVVGGTPLTRDPGRIHGTRFYLPPEMFKAKFRENLDNRADIYSLGLTLYEFAVGKNPFMCSEDVPYATIQRICRDTPPRLHSLRSDLSSRFCKLIDQMIKKRPALRPNSRTIKHFLEALI